MQCRKIRMGNMHVNSVNKNLRKPSVRAAVHLKKSMIFVTIGKTGKGD